MFYKRWIGKLNAKKVLFSLAIVVIIFTLAFIISMELFLYMNDKGNNEGRKTNITANSNTTNVIRKDDDDIEIDDSNNGETKDEDEKIEEIESNDYIMSNSSNEYLREEDLVKYTKGELGIIRNEIYAKHGYIFKNGIYKDYFGEKSWYNPSNEIIDIENYFNDYEKANIKLLKKLENNR